jgi:uncharacterized protein YhaN
MAIRIEQINIDNLGPIQKTQYIFKNINLIYSKNEGGKSLLVEFILCSLFKKNLWGYNREIGKGKVLVSGINNGTKDYSPQSSKEKLDKYFEKNLASYQTSLPKLLVIKGGETNIDESPDGINLDTLKKIFSSKNILDKIDGKISKTIQNTPFNDNSINIDDIDSFGEVKIYKDLKNIQIKKIDNLLKKLNENKIDEALKLNNEINDLKNKINKQISAKKYKAYILANEKEKLEKELKKYPDESIDEIKKNLDEYNKIKENIDKINKELSSLSSQINDLQNLRNNYDMQSKAKRYNAYLLYNQINGINQELDKISDNDINKLENNITIYKNKKEEYQRKSNELKQLEEKYKDYNWVTNLKNKYSDLKQKIYNKKFSLSYLIVAALVFVAGLTISIFNISNLIGILLMLVGFGFSIYFSLNLHKSLKQKAFNDELENLQKSFKEKFSLDLNEASLDSVISELDVSKLITRVQDELQNLSTEMSNLKSEIEKMFLKILAVNINEDEWLNELTKYIQHRNELKKQLSKLEKQYYELNVKEADFYTDSIEEKYDPEKFIDLEKKLNQLKSLEEQLQKKNNELSEEKEKFENLSKSINNEFINLLNEQVPESEWLNKLNNLINQINLTKSTLDNISGQLDGLGVLQKDFLDKDPGIVYDSIELENLENTLKDKQEQLNKINDENSAFKNDIIRVTGAQLNDNWETLIEKLNEKKREIMDQLRQKESFILAGVIVHNSITDLLKAEEQQIQNSINSKEFSDILYKVTGKYNGLIINNDGIISITSQIADYDLRDLSTGTKEQVLFALRVTLAEKILGDKAFFILDDAFQHSDYDRRPRLIDQLFTLANEGWQIIYLTMDDNIRELFKYQSVSSPNFQEIIL